MKITLTNQEFQDLIDGYVETGKDVLKRSGFLPDFELMPKLDKDIEEAVLEGADTFDKLQAKTKIGTGDPSCIPEAEQLLRFYMEKYYGAK
jgi:bacterioferritin-associated ferredoxin